MIGHKTPVKVGQSEMCVLSADWRTVQLQIPSARLRRRALPVKLVLECDATAVDELLNRLTLLRSQIEAPPVRAHEKAYLDHCSLFALKSAHDGNDVERTTARTANAAPLAQQVN